MSGTDKQADPVRDDGRPTKPMIPLTATERAARRADMTRNALRTRRTGLPRAWAVSSPSARRSMSRASQTEARRHRTTHGAIVAACPHSASWKLPRSQKTAWS